MILSRSYRTAKAGDAEMGEAEGTLPWLSLLTMYSSSLTADTGQVK